MIDITVSGLDKAIAELKAYKSSLLERCNRAQRAIAQLVRDTAQQGFDTAAVNGGHTPAPTNVTVLPDSSGPTVVIAEGDQAMFIEFGAGVYYNGTGIPYRENRAEFPGYEMGSYGMHNGLKDHWRYKGDDGKWHMTHGTIMQSPMYNAVISALPEIAGIIRSEFT